MKSSWKRSAKKGKKKKNQANTTTQSLALQSLPKSKPTTWVPPYPTIPKVPSTEDKFLSKPALTYQISITPDTTKEQPIVRSSDSKQKVFRCKDEHIKKEFMKTFRRLTNRWRSWDIWTDFVTMAACAISNSVDKLHYEDREKTYLRAINKYNKQERMLFPELFAYVVLALEDNPEQDFLGEIYTELGLNSREHEQIFTPYSVCYLMADITMGDLVEQIKKQGVIEIHDTCCGAGATLIAAANVAKEKLKDTELNFQNHILITGQDIDGLVAMMCYIQLSLLGMAGYFKVGNALTDPMTNNDSLDNYWFTPMYFSPVWHYRRVWRSIEKLFGGTENE